MRLQLLPFVRNLLAASLPPGANVSAPLPRLTLAGQWDRLVASISGSIDRTAATQRFHVAAEDRIDSAAYTLNEIILELSTIMTVPPRRPATTVVRLNPQATATHASSRTRVAAVA